MTPSSAGKSGSEIIALLGLQPHPEGGHYVETYRGPLDGAERPPGSAIYYLLAEGEFSRWHRIDATEIWHWYAGAPLELRISEGAGSVQMTHLGHDFAAGERPQVIVPPFVWQAARSLGPWTLVGCTVNPAFTFSGFELAPTGWEPGHRGGSPG
ncbi:MAG TPA: cupin domain-containing protein [Chthoniobacterales bacterium]